MLSRFVIGFLIKEQASFNFMAKEGENVKTGTDFIFLGSKLTEDGDCSHEIKRGLLLGRKAKAKIDSVLKAETSLC